MKLYDKHNVEDQFNKILIEENFNSFDSNKLINNNINFYVYEAYKLNKFQPIWITNKEFAKARTLLPLQISSLYDEGIILKEYPTSRMVYINEQVNDAILGNKSLNNDSLVIWDLYLTASYLKAAYLLLLGNASAIHAANDSVFNGASYLVLKMSNANEFPTFDAFRPSHPLYATGIFQIKQILSLQKDSKYIELYENFIKHPSHEQALMLLSYEITNQSVPNDSNLQAKIIGQYQSLHHLNISEQLDEATISNLKKSLVKQKENILTNLESLRQLKQHIAKDDYVWKHN